jgi:LCP family protein required for cell wall assembly
MASDGDNGRKPYERTYRGGGRRRSLDDELAGLRQARERPGEPSPASERRSPGDRRAGRQERPSSERERRAGADRRGAPRAAGGERFDWGEPRDPDAGEGTGSRPYRRYETDGAGAGDAARGAAKPARRRRFRWWHVPLALLTLLVVAAVVLTVIWYPGYKRFDRAVAKSNDRIDAKTRNALTPDEGTMLWSPTTVLVLGTDSKSGEPARSDTIMLMRFDPDTHTVNQLSIPRDTKVEVPGRGTMKINETMFWGGTSLAVKTIQDYVGIPINHVMVVDFKGFPRVVNAVGGIDLFVPETVSTVAGADRRVVTFKKGWNHFDGKYAMLYVRIRYADNDFKRAERQQRFVRALQKKIAQPSNITKLPDIGRRFMSGVDTDLTTSQLLTLGWVKWRADDKKSRHWVLAGEPAYIGGTAYVLPPSDAKKARVIAKFLGE